MKKIFVFVSLSFLITFASCGGGGDNSANQSNGEAPKSMVAEPESYDPKRGEGKYTAEALAITAAIDDAMATKGEQIADVKCTTCHKTTTEKLVGPGWLGVTTKRAPEWIMNFITNPDPMIDKDPEVQAQLELCLVRMPNQSLTDDDARNILEFMRKNDSAK